MADETEQIGLTDPYRGKRDAEINDLLDRADRACRSIEDGLEQLDRSLEAWDDVRADR